MSLLCVTTNRHIIESMAVIIYPVNGVNFECSFCFLTFTVIAIDKFGERMSSHLLNSNF